MPRKGTRLHPTLSPLEVKSSSLIVSPPLLLFLLVPLLVVTPMNHVYAASWFRTYACPFVLPDLLHATLLT